MFGVCCNQFFFEIEDSIYNGVCCHYYYYLLREIIKIVEVSSIIVLADYHLIIVYTTAWA